jgi:hypothetical protein
MAQQKKIMQGVSRNGSGAEAHLAIAETVAPEQDIPPTIDDALGIETKPLIPRVLPAFDLDAALGDEDALKSDNVADVEQPPRCVLQRNVSLSACIPRIAESPLSWNSRPWAVSGGRTISPRAI